MKSLESFGGLDDASTSISVESAYVTKKPDPSSSGVIEVLNEQVQLATDLIGYFVLAEWQLTERRLLVHFKREQQAEVIESLSFEPNPNSP